MALVARDVACGYEGRAVVSQVSFSLEPGGVLAVLGPNGVGKTTLFRTMLGFLHPVGGSVEIDGADVASMGRSELARAVSYVPQKLNIPFSYTVEEAVLMGRAPHLRLLQQPGPQDREIARQAMEEMGVTDLAKKSCTEISGGELQMVCIARALAQRPRYVVMDEPTASLDFGNQARVLERIASLAADGMGILMTTHDPEQAFSLDCDVALIRPGGTCTCGGCREVLTEETLSSVYGTEVLVREVPYRGGVATCCMALVGRRG